MRQKFYFGFFIILALTIIFLAALYISYYFIVGMLAALVIIWIYDRVQKEHSVLRNYPVIGHLRFILEFVGPQIHQYFVADNQSEQPFTRELRSLVYQRAKGIRDTIPFGTEHDVSVDGYEWVQHSLAPKHKGEVTPRITIGGPQCTQAYSASYLNISGMSLGAISKNAVIALNEGARIGGFAHNIGEGGLTTYHLAGGGDLIFQIGTAYFGVRTKDGRFDPGAFHEKSQHPHVKMIELKLSQGAKPAHGAYLPAAKVDKFIAEIRGIEVGKDSLSPPGHSTFSTPIEMLEFIAKLRELSGGKPVGFKLCIGKRKEFLSICKAMLKTGILPDFITVDGAEGGTGAGPVEFVDHVGTPLKDGLMFVRNALMGINVRDKIRIIAAGKIVTGFNMLKQIALGADLCNAARSFMFALGCIQAMQCHANTCPTGVATQDKRLGEGLVVALKKQRVANFHAATLDSFLQLVGAIGLSTPEELNPAHVFRRVEDGVIKPYSEIYQFLNAGDLLGKHIPEKYAEDWHLAKAEEF